MGTYGNPSPASPAGPYTHTHPPLEGLILTGASSGLITAAMSTGSISTIHGTGTVVDSQAMGVVFESTTDADEAYEGQGTVDELVFGGV